MKHLNKKFSIGLPALFALLCIAWQGPTTASALQFFGGFTSSGPDTHNGSVSFGGTKFVGVVSSNSGDTTTATNNTAALQTALTAGGKIIVSISGGTVAYVNSTMTIPSYTHLEIPKGLTLRAMASTGNMFQNFAVTRSWTTLYDNSGVVTNGALSMIRAADVPAWVASTAYVQGNYVYDATSANVYWCTTSGTSTTGSGPSGTGTNISDGTAVWNYVTAWVPPPPATALNFAMIHWAAHGLSVGNSIHVTAQPDSGANNYWSASQTAHTRGGPCDTAFFGVFNVTAVNDSNWVTVLLWRPPAAAFSGIPVNIRKADQSIKLSGGGTLDYNDPTNVGSGIAAFCINICGVSRFQIDGLEVVNSAKYNLNLAGVQYADVGHFDTGPVGSFSDRVKVYGPAFQVNIHDSTGADGDDIISIQPAEDSTYASYTQAVGDCQNIQVSNIASDSGASVSIYPSKSPVSAIVDQIDISRIYINNANSNAVVINGTGAASAANIGTVSIHDVDLRQCAATLLQCSNNSGNSAFNIDAINIYNCVSGNTLNTNNSNLVKFGISGSAPWTVGVLNIYNCDVSPYAPMLLQNGTQGVSINVVNVYGNNILQQSTSTALINFGGSSAATIGTLNIRDNNISLLLYLFSSASTNVSLINIENNYIAMGSSSYVVYNNSGSQVVKKVNLLNNTLKNTPAYVINDAYGMDINLVGNYMPDNTRGWIQSNANSTVYAQGNNCPNASFGFVRFSGVVTCTFTSGGGNTVSSNTWFTRPSAGLVIPYGFDIHDDVTKWTRTSGAYGFNTNTSPGSGTLTTAGPVMCQGTSANSWFLLQNASGQVY